MIGVAGASRDDLIRRLDETTALLERLPADDPAVAAALAGTSSLLSALGLDRAVLADGQVAARVERLAEVMPDGHPMTVYVRFLVPAIRYMQAHLARDTERAEALLIEMAGSAGAVPAGHPMRPFVLCGVATAYAERHTLNGDLRNLDLAWQYIEDALVAAEQAGGGLFAPGGAPHGFLLHVRGHVRMLRNVYDPKLPEVDAAIEDLERALAQIGQEWAAQTDLTSVLDTARVMREQLIAPSGPGRPLGAATSRAFGNLSDAARDHAPWPGRVPHRCRAGGRRAGDARAGDGRRDPGRSGDRPARRRRRDPRPRAARAAQGAPVARFRAADAL